MTTPYIPEAPIREHAFDPDQEQDLFRYGWRYVPHTVNGDTEWERVPLTLDDVLHPQEEDYIIQSEPHVRLCVYLWSTIRRWMSSDPTAKVLYEVLVDWGVEGVKNHSPDLVVFTGVQRKREWTTFDRAWAGGQPQLVLEVTSTHTRHLDMAPRAHQPDAQTKFLHYAWVGVPYYIIIDQARQKEGAAPPILGYFLQGDAYQLLPLDERGWLWVEPLGLWLGPEGTDIFWYTADGELIRDYERLDEYAKEEAQARIAAQARAEQEAQARIAAQARAEQEAQARIATQACAEQEAQARIDAQARAEELEREKQQTAIESEQRGQLEEKRQIARTMLAEGIDPALVAKITGLPISEMNG